MEELTEKQRYQREYYARNKARICATKRDQYVAKLPRKPRKELSVPKSKEPKRRPVPKLLAEMPAIPAAATCPVKQVDKLPRKARHSIEDLRLARELGIDISDLD
ncbi:hypothetical protein NTE19_003392 [Vibrio fluvialis]|nr:hypothetical protein [Vibrio fluvialis]